MVASPPRAALAVAMLITAGIATGAGTGYAAAARAQDPYHELDRFADVLWRIETVYVDPKESDELVDAAIRGMMRDLDEHSRWLSADEARVLAQDTQGSYEGIGVEVRQAQDSFTIARVLPDGPAEFAGLAAGDTIVAVDGHPTAGLTLDDLSERLKGPRGAEVTLSVLRPGWDAPQDIPAVRDRVHAPSVDAEYLADGVVYAHLWQFQKGCADDLDSAIRATLGKRELRSVVLDLRDNPGGLLEEAVGVADLFLDSGPIVSTRGRLEGEIVYSASVGGFPADVKVVLLVNGMSASASEIVTGALQDTGRARVVGTRTYGKGSVQTLFTYPDESALKLTIAHYYTPSGAPVADHQGRVPDVLVPFVKADPNADRLRERIGHVEGLSEADRDELMQLVDAMPVEALPPAPVPWDLHGVERMEADPQLRAAMKELGGR